MKFLSEEDIWDDMDIYSVVEAAALCVGVSPNNIDESGGDWTFRLKADWERFNDAIQLKRHFNPDDEEAEIVPKPEDKLLRDKLAAAFDAMLVDMFRAIEAKKLTANLCFEPKPKDGSHYRLRNLPSYVRDGAPNLKTTTIAKHDLLVWLANKKKKPFFFFPDPISLNSGVGELPGYLDPNHKCYSHALAAAIASWNVLSESKLKKGVKPSIEGWLTKENAAGRLLDPDGKPFSSTKKEAIADVVNWNLKGGQPKIS